MEGEWDVGLVASFGYFIPGRIIKVFKKAILNAHPSLLPRYRGASPIQHTIMHGDVRTGVTIIDLDSKEFDAGNVWAQEEASIGPCREFGHLEEELAQTSGRLFSQVLSDIDHYKVEPNTHAIVMVARLVRETATRGSDNVCAKDSTTGWCRDVPHDDSP